MSKLHNLPSFSNSYLIFSNWVEATIIWDDILQTHPTDILALKLAHDTYFYLGYQKEMKDSVERVLPHWSPDIPLYGLVQYLYIF